MADISKCDRQKFKEIQPLLQALYPEGEKHFATLAPTLRYMADLMDEVIAEMEGHKNPTGVVH